ncbi:MAG: ABC transporter substrate-binding protein [bacterium]
MRAMRIILYFFTFILLLDLMGCVERFAKTPPTTPETKAPSEVSTTSPPTTPSPPTALRIAVLPEDLVDYGVLSDAANILRDALGIDVQFVSPQSDCDLYVGTAGEIASMVQQGKLQPLQDILPSSSSLASAFVQGGNLYALPLGGKGKVLLINTSLLLEKGIPPRAPATFEEWAKMMRLLKARGVRYPLFLPMRGDNLLENFELFSAIYGGSSYSQDKPSFSDASRRALIALSTLAKEDLLDPLSYEGGEEEAKQAVKGGGSAFAVVWGDELPAGVEVALIPPSQDIYDLEKKPAVSLGKIKGIALLANSPLAKEGKAFLKLVWHLQKRDNRDIEALALTYGVPCPSFRSYASENQVVARFISSAIQGIISPEEAIQRAQEALKALPQQVPQAQPQVPQTQPQVPQAQPQIPQAQQKPSPPSQPAPANTPTP